MNAKTMEGLAGAGTNMKLLDTPIRVFKEARRKGDMATMERAIGYASEISDKAQEYKAKASKGMEEDAEEAREKANTQREEAVKRRREEREKLEEEIRENRNADTDTVEISGEGKQLLQDHFGPDRTVSAEIKTDAVNEPMTYTKTGETVLAEQSPGVSVSV